MTTDPEALPPCDLDAERAVLGAILGGGEAVAEVPLKPDEMYHWAVADELKRRGELARVGGAPYLITCMEATPTAANVGYWADIVREKARRRGVVQAGREVAQRGLTSTEDVDELVDRVRTRLDALAAPTEDVAAIGALSDERAAAYEHELPPCLPTGLLDLDHLLGGGLRPGQLVVVAGRPGTGKALALDTPLPTPTPVAWHVARHDPASVLAECAVKRRIVESGRCFATAEFPDFDGGYRSAWEDHCRILASVYADHPEYRPVWAS